VPGGLVLVLTLLIEFAGGDSPNPPYVVKELEDCDFRVGVGLAYFY
jgi:hypothetical protein